MCLIFSEAVSPPSGGKRKRETSIIFPLDIWDIILRWLPIEDFGAFRETCRDFRFIAGQRKFFLHNVCHVDSDLKGITGLAANEDTLVISVREPPGAVIWDMTLRGRDSDFYDPTSVVTHWEVMCVTTINDKIALGTKGNTIEFYDRDIEHAGFNAGHTSAVSCIIVAWGDRMVSGSWDGSVSLWKNTRAWTIEIPPRFDDHETETLSSLSIVGLTEPPRVSALCQFGDFLVIGYENGLLSLVDELGNEIAVTRHWEWMENLAKIETRFSVRMHDIFESNKNCIDFVSLVSFDGRLACATPWYRGIAIFNDKLEVESVFGLELYLSVTTMGVLGGDLIAGTKDGRIVKFDKNGKKIFDCVETRKVDCGRIFIWKSVTKILVLKDEVVIIATTDGTVTCGTNVLVPETFLF